MSKWFFILFFVIAIAVHIYLPIIGDGNPLWWHAIYWITYGCCLWCYLFSFSKKKLLFTTAAIFPFVTHLYTAIQRIAELDTMFWICVVVCVLLIVAYFFIDNE